jgi:hypothetical protein
LRHAALSRLLGHDADTARERPDAWKSAVIVRNRAARARAGVAELVVDVALAHVPVGPGSGGRVRRIESSSALDVPTQVLSRERRYARLEAPSFYPINYAIERRRSLAWVSNVPAYGIVALPVGGSARSPNVPAEVRVAADKRGIHCARGSLMMGRRGLTWRAAGAPARGAPLFELEIVRDRGDLYTAALEPSTRGRGVLRSSRVSQRGPLRAAIDSTWRVTTRSGRGADGAVRSSVDVRTQAALDAGGDFIRVRASGENAASDYRLRIVFNTGLRPRHVLADAAFALVRRQPLRVPAADRRAETPPATAPLHRFVTLFDGRRGCTVVSDGLAEYETLESGAVAVTLVRAVGQLSRNDLPQRPGHAGWPEATPLAQCSGPFEAEFAIAWHAGDSAATRAHILKLVDDVLLPLAGDTRRDLLSIPEPIQGFALEGDGLAFSTLKESEDGTHVVARLVNVTGAEVHGALVLPRDVQAAHRARLDETPLAALAVHGRRIPILVAPHGIFTALVALDSDATR